MKRVVVVLGAVLAVSCASNEKIVETKDPIAADVKKEAEESKLPEKAETPKDELAEKVANEEVQTKEMVLEKQPNDLEKKVVEEEVKEDTKAEKIVETKTELSPAPEKKSLFVSSSLLNVRSGPGMKFSVVRTLKFGDALSADLSKENKIWVKLAEGEYVSSRFLSAEKPLKPVDPVQKEEKIAPTDAAVEAEQEAADSSGVASEENSAPESQQAETTSNEKVEESKESASH